MTNRLLTPGEAAKIFADSINAYIKQVPAHLREQAAWAMCNSLSLALGGPGVARPKKKKTALSTA